MSTCNDSQASRACQEDLDVRPPFVNAGFRESGAHEIAPTGVRNLVPLEADDKEAVSVMNLDTDDGLTDGGDTVEQTAPPPADRRNELAADMIPRRGEERAVHEQALAMTRNALEEVACRVAGEHSVHDLRNLANKRVSNLGDKTAESDQTTGS